MHACALCEDVGPPVFTGVGEALKGTPFIGEIRLFAGYFAPSGWAFCNGALTPISGNEALFTLIGTTYGGDGQSNFALPDLRSRTPVHMGADGVGNTYALGMQAGAENVTLTLSQAPAHTHALNAVGSGQSFASPSNALPGVSTSSQAGTLQYGAGAGQPTTLSPATIGTNGGSQPHSNIQPYLALNYIIALDGMYPSRG